MTVFKSDLAQGVDILADMVKNPALPTFGKEMANILRKLEETEQDTRKVIDDRLHACAFRDYALGYSCTAPFEGIENLSQAAKIQTKVSPLWINTVFFFGIHA